ncbi:hypothetical protein SRHO_G00140890 [Serrasalmus rhombeus]
MKMEAYIQNEPLQYQNIEREGKAPRSSAAQHARVLRLAAASVGVMCILQATLNIVLRLSFNQAQTVCNQLTTERDQLQKERDDLQRRLSELGE